MMFWNEIDFSFFRSNLKHAHISSVDSSQVSSLGTLPSPRYSFGVGSVAMATSVNSAVGLRIFYLPRSAADDLDRLFAESSVR